MKAVFGIFLLLLLLVLLFGTAGRELFLFLKSARVPLRGGSFTLIYTLLLLLSLALFIGSYAAPKMPRAFAALGQYAAGFWLYFALVFDALAFLFLILKIVPSLRAMPDRGRVALSLTALLAAAGLFCYGAIHAQVLKTKTYTVASKRACDTVRIALVSDLHLGRVTGAARLEKVGKEIEEAKPDIILIAGDVFDSSLAYLSDQDAAKKALAAWNAPLGVWACLGNHDAGETLDAMRAFLEEAGVRLLEDEAEAIGDRLIVAGRRDSSPIGGADKREPLPIPVSEPELPVVVMDHQPGNIGEYGAEVDLVVCGHTHRGQVFPGNLITRALYEVDYGYYKKDAASPHVVVTSGVGFWGPPLRVGSDSELALIELVPET